LINFEIWAEKSHTVQVEEAVMDHKAENKAVKGEDPETISQGHTLQAIKLRDEVYSAQNRKGS
jgi:hypothetical protein